MDDIHRLYYNYPLIKVNPHVLDHMHVLQTYNFRVNATSRVYFEVGMHLLTSHVSLQLTTLNERGFTV
jgi:BioD-like phosphotransacetylase family protein